MAQLKISNGLVESFLRQQPKELNSPLQPPDTAAAADITLEGKMTTFNDLLEALRVRAETDTPPTTENIRRPSWAPALIVKGELLELLHALELLTPDTLSIIRLWPS